MHHVADPQVLQGDPVVLHDQPVRQLVEVVLALVLDPLVLPLKCLDRFAPVAAALLAAGNTALKDAQLLLFLAIPARVLHLLAVARGDQAVDAHVDPDFFARSGQRLRCHFAGEAGIPLARVAGDPHRLDLAVYRAVPANGDSANARQFQLAPVDLEAVAVLLEPEGVEAIQALEAWVARSLPGFHPPKEGVEGFVEVLNDHLQDVAVDAGGVGILPLQTLDLGELSVNADTLAAFLVGVAALLQASVVPQATGFERSVQPRFLRLGGIQPILEGLLHLQTPLRFDVALDDVAGDVARR